MKACHKSFAAQTFQGGFEIRPEQQQQQQVNSPPTETRPWRLCLQRMTAENEWLLSVMNLRRLGSDGEKRGTLHSRTKILKV